MKTILQHDIKDCGAACLAMIAHFYGLKLPISKCRELTRTDRTGTNLYGLVDAAKKIGFDAKALSGTSEELMNGIYNGSISFPFVAHIVSDGTMLHYVVVFGLKKGKFVIGDPSKGKIDLHPDAFWERWTGYIVIFRKNESFARGNFTKSGFIKFFRLLKGQYIKLSGVLLISLLVSIIGIAGAFVFEIVIDEFALNTGYYESMEGELPDQEYEDSQNHPDIHEHEAESALTHFLEIIYENASRNFHIIFSALLFLYILRSIIQYIRGCLVVSISKKIDIRLSLSYYSHIVDLPISSTFTYKTGEYLSRFSDAATIRQAISGATVTLLLDSIMVIACGCILFLQNKRLFFVALLIVVLYTIIVLFYRRPVEQSNRKVMDNNAQMQSYFKESIDGMETIKAACANQQIKETTISKFNRFIDSVVHNSLISLSQDSLVDMIDLVGTVVILWLGFSMVLAQQITIGSLITFYALMTYFTEPIKNLIELQPMIQTALVAADRLNDILDMQCEVFDESKSSLFKIDSWELRNIDFRYGNRELILKNASFSINRGEKIAIVGESGSGKTTLAKLLLRFYEPERGTILLDGEDIQTFDLAALRKGIAYVDQNTFLFSDTIKNNLKLGNPDATDEDIASVCKTCHVDEFISSLPLGYDTPLDENGTNLSGGQRQRLAIARALLKKPQLLILDEATSNLDTITETAIKNTIFDFDADLTYIIIAHRLTTIKNCDRIYVMEHGEMVETGTHEELMRAKGKYASLWKSQ